MNERATTRSLARGAAEGLKTRLVEARRVIAILHTFVKTAGATSASTPATASVAA